MISRSLGFHASSVTSSIGGSSGGGPGHSGLVCKCVHFGGSGVVLHSPSGTALHGGLCGVGLLLMGSGAPFYKRPFQNSSTLPWSAHPKKRYRWYRASQKEKKSAAPVDSTTEQRNQHTHNQEKQSGPKHAQDHTQTPFPPQNPLQNKNHTNQD